MDIKLDETKFKQYFHYGLDYKKEDLLDSIIFEASREKNKANDDNTNNLEETIKFAKNLYVQFVRFIDLASEKNKNWYRSVNSETVTSEIMERIDFLEENNLIYIVNYEPFYGIYISDRDPGTKKLGMSGADRNKQIPNWIKKDILPILKYLSNLEYENPYQYNSLFLDTKYARSINNYNDEATKKIKSIYKTFLAMVKPAKSDMYNFFGKNISKDMESYIQNNYPDYWTVTDLKEQVMDDKYSEKIKKHCKNIEEQFGKDLLE